MGVFKNVRNGIQRAGRFAGAQLRKAGRFAYNNRDLIARGAGIAAPIVAAGLAGGPAGALGAAAVQKEEIGKLAKDIKKRRAGKSKAENVNYEDLKKVGRELVGGKPRPPGGYNSSSHVKNKLDQGKMHQLKVLAQGQEV